MSNFNFSMNMFAFWAFPLYGIFTIIQTINTPQESLFHIAYLFSGLFFLVKPLDFAKLFTEFKLSFNVRHPLSNPFKS